MQAGLQKFSEAAGGTSTVYVSPSKSVKPDTSLSGFLRYRQS